MDSLFLKNLTIEVQKLAQEAGTFIREEQKQFKSHQVEIKGFNSLVSYVDKQTEQFLVEGLSKLLPEAGFITEEETVENERKALSWVIDPLDGTTNFIHGLPIFSVSIGLLHQDDLLLGSVYESSQNESFYAWKNGGAFCNGEPIKVSESQNINECLFATGFPYYDYGRMEAFKLLLSDFFEGTRGLRRLGSAATDLAWVACGRFDGFFEYGLSPWDVAGGSIIVTEAGGRVSDFRGKSDFIFGKTLISSNKKVYESFLKFIRNRMD